MPKMKMTDVSIRALKAPKTGQIDMWDGSLPGFGMRVTAKGRKTWQMMTRHNGVQQRLKLGTYPSLSLADARKEAHDIVGRVEKGEPPRPPKDDEQQPDTVAGVANDYFELMCSQHRKGKETETIMRREILPKWRNRPIADITKQDVRNLVLAKHRAGYPAAAHRLHRIVKAFFRWAEKQGYIYLSPVGSLDAPQKLNVRKRVLSDDELVALWRSCAHEGHPYGHIVRLLILSGQRRGEVGGMRWQDLNLDEGLWVIPGDQNKSDREHLVPLSDPMIAILRNLPRLSETYVFPSPRADRPIAGFGRAKERFDKLTDYQIPDWRVHDIRRTTASGMRKLGVDRTTVGEVLNHARQGVTGIVYDQYDCEAEMRAALVKWGEKVTEITMPPVDNVVTLRSA